MVKERKNHYSIFVKNLQNEKWILKKGKDFMLANKPLFLSLAKKQRNMQKNTENLLKLVEQLKNIFVMTHFMIIKHTGGEDGIRQSPSC